MTLRRKLDIWVWITLVTVVCVGIAIRWVDMPVATLFNGRMSHVDLLSRGLGSAVLVSGEVVVAASLTIMRIVRREISPFGRAVLIGCCVSLCTFAANDHALKLLFGRPNPGEVLFAQAMPSFQFFQGSFRSSFPSGHMAMACSFGMVMMRGVPRLAPWLGALLAFAAALLVMGDWHFVSDVVAGSYLGCLAGFWAWEVWTLHMRHWAGEDR